MIPPADQKKFREGVISAGCDATITLLEFVGLTLAKPETNIQTNINLSPLDLIELGSVYVNDARNLNPEKRLKAGDQVRIHSKPRRFKAPHDLRSRVLHEDANSLLFDKPAGIPLEPLVDNSNENLISFLEEQRGQRYYPTHHLELESDGLVLIAKSLESQALINKAFKEGLIKRRYSAYVESPAHQGWHDGLHVLSCQELKALTNLISERQTTWTVVSAPLECFYKLEIEFSSLRPKEAREKLAQVCGPVIGDQAFGSKYQLIDSATGKKALAFLATGLSL